MGSAGSVLDFTAQTDLDNSVTAAANIAAEDPPPKYTPPPSYTTATGARYANLSRFNKTGTIQKLLITVTVL